MQSYVFCFAFLFVCFALFFLRSYKELGFFEKVKKDKESMRWRIEKGYNKGREGEKGRTKQVGCCSFLEYCHFKIALL